MFQKSTDFFLSSIYIISTKWIQFKLRSPTYQLHGCLRSSLQALGKLWELLCCCVCMSRLCLYVGSPSALQCISAMTVVDLKDMSSSVITDTFLCGQHFFVLSPICPWSECLRFCHWHLRSREQTEVKQAQKKHAGGPLAKMLRTCYPLVVTQWCLINKSIQSWHGNRRKLGGWESWNYFCCCCRHCFC